jgi:hypothetical protein
MDGPSPSWQSVVGAGNAVVIHVQCGGEKLAARPRTWRGPERKTHTLVEYIIGGFVPRRGTGKSEGKARQRLNFTATTPRYW